MCPYHANSYGTSRISVRLIQIYLPENGKIRARNDECALDPTVANKATLRIIAANNAISNQTNPAFCESDSLILISGSSPQTC